MLFPTNDALYWSDFPFEKNSFESTITEDFIYWERASEETSLFGRFGVTPNDIA